MRARDETAFLIGGRYLNEGLLLQRNRHFRIWKLLSKILSPAFSNPNPRLRRFCFPNVEETVDCLGGGLETSFLSELVQMNVQPSSLGDRRVGVLSESPKLSCSRYCERAFGFLPNTTLRLKAEMANPYEAQFKGTTIDFAGVSRILVCSCASAQHGVLAVSASASLPIRVACH